MNLRIYFNPLNRNDFAEHELPIGTEVCEWLTANYPKLDTAPKKIFVKGNELEEERYEVEPLDTVVVFALPTEITTAQVISALVAAAVSTAVGLIIGYLFPPSAPKSIRGTEESPTYSIGATRNRARPGEPIPVHYGRTVYPPDFASAPYSYYQASSDDQYVDQLMVLGAGEYRINQIYIGQTPLKDLKASAVQYWVYGPNDHNQTFDVIAADVSQKALETQNPAPFYENVYSSPEVTEIQLTWDKSESSGSPQLFNNDSGTAFAEPELNQPGYLTGVPTSVAVKSGDLIDIQGTQFNNGQMQVGAVVDAGMPAGEWRIFEENLGRLTLEQFPPGATYQLNTVDIQNASGPFRAQKQGQSINGASIDITFPAGLQGINNQGANFEITIEFRVIWQQIDPDTGENIGPGQGDTFFVTGNTASAVRRTIESGPLAPGSYKVTLIRVTRDDQAGRNLYRERSFWTGLKGYVVNDVTQPAYGPVTLMAVRLKATNGVSALARERIRVDATRLINGVAVSNPIAVIKDIFTNSQYGMGRSSSELNNIELDAIEEKWASGPYFNGSFDQRNTGTDAMQQVISVAGARVLQDNALITVVPDEAKYIRTAMFSSANILQGSLSITYGFDQTNDYDGVQVEYRDSNFDPVFAVYPTDATQPESVFLFGCTDQTYAEEFARYLWNDKSIRRKRVSFETELEGLIPRFGDRIAISHPLPSWGLSGVVIEAIDAQTYRLDQVLPWTGTPVILFRNEHGEPHGPYTITQGAEPDIVVLDTVPVDTVYTPVGQEPTNYAYGESTTLVRDFVVSKVSPRGGNVVQIEGAAYDESVFVGGPPHMSALIPLGVTQQQTADESNLT